MKKSPKVLPLFISLSVALAAVPTGALAQVVVRPVIAPAAMSGAAAAGVTASALTALPPLVPLNILSAAAPVGLTAPAIAPALTPAAAAVPLAAAAAQAPAAAAALEGAPAAASLPLNDSPVAAADVIRTPGAAAAGLAVEAAAYSNEHPGPAAAAVADAPAHRSLVGRLADVVLGRIGIGALFDSSSARGETAAPIFGRTGLQAHKPVLLPNGTRPDEQPTTPSPDREATVRLQTYSLPGARDVGGVLETTRKVLAADPQNVGAVVAAVKAMVDADPARYGVNSSELRLIGARRFDGHGGQADSIFIHFRQVKDNLVVNGADLSFTLKVIDGKPMVVAQTGQMFPQIDVDTESTLTDEQIMGRIAERVGMPVSDAASTFEYAGEKILYSRGAWRHVKLYVADGLPFMIAVDLSNGLVFAWDNRTGLTSARKKKSKDSGVSGTVSGKAVDHGPILPTAVLKDIPLGFLNLTIGGKTYTTDKDGHFTADGLQIVPEGMTLTATLSGPFVNIQDTTGNTLKINVTLKPGNGGITAVFNPDSTINDENAIAQVSAFHKVNLAYNFLRERKLTTEQMDKNAIVVKTNIDDECNAFYTPGSPSLNFFKSSANCVNSAYDTVADHEYGHYWDDSTGGIMNGGLSEGWGDTLSMYLLNNPVIGEHFLKHPGPDGKDYIRHGDNTYQYNEFDEVHEQGQAWQGFTWKLRKALMAELGDAAGAAMAEALVLPTMFAKAATIPDAMAQVLVNAMKKDGTIMYEDLIRATAKIHGIVLPQNPGKGFVASFFDRFTAPLNRLTNLEERFYGSDGPGNHWAATGLNTLAADAPIPTVRATMKFSAGALLRGRVANEVRRYLDATGLHYELHEYKSLLSTDYLLVIDGPQDKVQQHTDALSRWLQNLANSN